MNDINNYDNDEGEYEEIDEEEDPNNGCNTKKIQILMMICMKKIIS